MTRERPILFSAEMVRAILDGRKTQTRRIVKPQPASWIDKIGPSASPLWWIPSGVYIRDSMGILGHGAAEARLNDVSIKCPYGVPGDRLVFLCTWATERRYDKIRPSILPKSARIWSYFDGTDKPAWCGKSRPGRFMPKRLRLRMPKGEILQVHVGRVQSISEEDAIAEGVEKRVFDNGAYGFAAGECPSLWANAARGAFSLLWDSINGKRPGCSWESNPWVWALTFKRIA